MLRWPHHVGLEVPALDPDRLTYTPTVLPGGGIPGPNFRWSFEKGMSGWDVYGFQVGLNSHQKSVPISEDGIFGPQTDAAVKREQQNHHLEVDGKAGPRTQSAICLAEAKRAESASNTAPGLLASIMFSESGYNLAACGGPNTNGSYDAGALCWNIPVSSLNDINAWHHAFDFASVLDWTGQRMRSKFDLYYGQLGAQTPKRAWECAALAHNWPAASEKTAYGKFDTWRYLATDSNGVKRYYGVDEAAYWIIKASGGRLSTARQWRDFYIAAATRFVTAWPA